MKKNKSKIEETSLEFYYHVLFEHKGFTIHDKYKSELRRMGILNSILLVLIILLLVFKESRVVSIIFSNSEGGFWTSIGIAAYTFLCVFTYTVYHIISICFEKRNKYELCFKKGNLYEKTSYVTVVIVHFVWIVIAILVLRILKKLKIYNLKESMPIIIGGYMWSFVLMLIAFLWGLTCFKKWNVPIGTYFSEKTYVYFLVFLVVWLFGKIPYCLLKWASTPLKKNQISKYENIFKEYALLNKYLLLVITFFLQALSFDGAEKELIDALFYATTIFALVDECKK